MRKTDTRTFAGLACGLILAVVGPFLAAVGGESGVGDDSGVGYESGVGDESGVGYESGTETVGGQSGIELLRAETYAATTRGADGYWYRDLGDRFIEVYATAYRSSGVGSEDGIPGKLSGGGRPAGPENQDHDRVLVYVAVCEPRDEEEWDEEEDYYACRGRVWRGSADGFEQDRALRTASYHGVLADRRGRACDFDIVWDNGGKPHTGSFTFAGGYADGGRRSTGAFADVFSNDGDVYTWSSTENGGGWHLGDAGAGVFTGAALWREAGASIDATCLPNMGDGEFGAIWADAVVGGGAGR